jgi:hypothetical protein
LFRRTFAGGRERLAVCRWREIDHVFLGVEDAVHLQADGAFLGVVEDSRFGSETQDAQSAEPVKK